MMQRLPEWWLALRLRLVLSAFSFDSQSLSFPHFPWTQAGACGDHLRESVSPNNSHGYPDTLRPHCLVGAVFGGRARVLLGQRTAAEGGGRSRTQGARAGGC